MNEADTDLRERPQTEVDLTDRLRFAAGSLAADFGHEVSLDHAEALVFSSAEGLLAAASVTEFVPILAERRARLAMRAAPAAVSPLAPAAAVAPLDPAEDDDEILVAVEVPLPDIPRPDVAPLFSVPEGDLARLRDEIDRLRTRVSDWRADQRQGDA